MLKLITRWSERRDKAKERLEICKNCEHYVHETTQCLKCLCFMEAKTLLPSSECPIEKWGKYKEEQKWMR